MKFPGLSDTQIAGLTRNNPQWDFKQIRYGEGQHPIIIIDNFSTHAQDLIADSQAQSFRAHGPHYPGVQAAAPVKYLHPHQQALGFLMSQAFGYGDTPAQFEMCMYSYVTTPPEDLSPLQRYPHYDGGHPQKVALLHYLCDEGQGGTNFYRHDRTGFETVFPERDATFRDARHEDVEEIGLREASYFSETADGFTRLQSIPARFNRAILYPSCTLHSGNLGPAPQFTTHPDTGRLTVNSFFVPTT